MTCPRPRATGVWDSDLNQFRLAKCLDAEGCKGAPEVEMFPGRGVDLAFMERVRNMQEGCRVGRRTPCALYGGSLAAFTVPSDMVVCRPARMGTRVRSAIAAPRGLDGGARLHAQRVLPEVQGSNS